jgi:hypothetical protein
MSSQATGLMIWVLCGKCNTSSHVTRQCYVLVSYLDTGNWVISLSRKCLWTSCKRQSFFLYLYQKVIFYHQVAPFIGNLSISINFIIVCSFKILLYLVTMVIFEFHILRGPSKFYLIWPNNIRGEYWVLKCEKRKDYIYFFITNIT